MIHHEKIDGDQPDNVVDIFLQPGDFYFGDANTRIRTLLGSCVSITMWHPQLLIGGMCHYLLPSRNKHGVELDGHYADDAMQMFIREIKATNTRPSEYRVKLFGGGNMFPNIEMKKFTPSGPKKSSNKQKSVVENCHDVPCKNVQAARNLMATYGFEIEAQDLGGIGHRHILFDIWSGNAWVRKHTVII